MAFIGTLQKRTFMDDLTSGFQAGAPLAQMLQGKQQQKEEQEKKLIEFIMEQYQNTDDEGRQQMEGSPEWPQFQALIAKHGLSTMMPGGQMIMPRDKPEYFGTPSQVGGVHKVVGEKVKQIIPGPQPSGPKTIEAVAAGEILKLRDKGVPDEEWPNWIRVKAGLEPTGYQAGTLENKKQKLVLEGERIGISREKTTASIRFIDAKITSMKTRDELAGQVALWKKELGGRKTKVAENNSEIRRLQVEGGLENKAKILGLKTENQQHNHRMDELNYALDKADVESRIKVREEKVLQGWADLHRKSEELGLKREDTASRIKMVQAKIDDLIKKGNLAEESNNWKRDAKFRGLELRQLETKIKEELGKGRLANQEELNRLRGVANEQRYQLGLLNAGIDLADLYLEAQRPAGKGKELDYTYKQIGGVTRVIKGEELIKDIPPPEGYAGKDVKEQKNILAELVGKASSATKPTFGEWGPPGLDRYADTLRALIEVDPRLSEEIKALYKSYISKITGSALAAGLEGESGIVPVPGSISLDEFVEIYRRATEGKAPPSAGVTSLIAQVANEAMRIHGEQGIDAAEKYAQSQGFTLEQIASYLKKTRKK